MSNDESHNKDTQRSGSRCISQDDDPRPGGSDQEQAEQPPRSYYYDDTTGYELYDPQSGDDDDDRDCERDGESETERLP